MELLVNSYLGKAELVYYLIHNRTNLSYREFLSKYHDTIYIASIPFISSLPFSNWNTFDDYWALKFFDEANDLIKEKKILKKSTIDILKEKINKERLQHERYLQIYWYEIIKNYKKEDLIPGATYTKKTIRKTYTKDNIKPDLMFCHNILYELQNTIWAYPFYKFFKKSDIYNLINNPIDLFTINLKLENNQYNDSSEFEEDIYLMFHNCFVSNNIGTEMHNAGKELISIFKDCWDVYQYQGNSRFILQFDQDEQEVEEDDIIEQNDIIEQDDILEQELFQIEPEDLQEEIFQIKLEDLLQEEDEDFEPIKLEDLLQKEDEDFQIEPIKLEDLLQKEDEGFQIELEDLLQDEDFQIEQEDFQIEQEIISQIDEIIFQIEQDQNEIEKK